MNMPTSSIASTGRYHLGDLELDVDERRVMRQGCDLNLPKLTYRTLMALASAAPNLVTKDELADHVWGGRPVSTETIAQRVKMLRNALDDDAQSPRYVEVVRGEGYRWLPRVVAVESSAPDPGEPLVNPESAEGIELTLPAQPSIAVLPFESIGEDSIEHRVFADGLTHDIITSIGRARWLFVVARGSTFKFRGVRTDVQSVAEMLGVRYVVQGNIGYDGPKISVNVALIDAVAGREIWAERLRSEIGDVFTIQEEIADLVVGSVESEIEHSEQKRAMLKPPENLDAWSAYHRAWWHLNSFAPDCFEQAEKFFNHSLELDPMSARTLAGLSSVHWLRAFLEVCDDRSREVDTCLELAHQSVQLDTRDPLAHWALGRAFHLCCEFDRSVQEYAVANQLNPNFALGQLAQAFAMMHVGEHEQSSAFLDRARRLSPYDTMSYAMLGIQAVNNAMLDRYDVAADLSVRGARLLTFYCQMFPVIAAYCNVLAGREDVGHKYYTDLQSTRPGYSRDDYFRAFPHQPDRDVSRIAGAFEVLERMH